MNQPSNQKQVKQNLLSYTTAILGDMKFTHWLPIAVFLGIPVAIGINLYVFIDSIARNIILSTAILPVTRMMQVTDLNSWMLGYTKLGTVLIDLLAFITTSFLLFAIGNYIRKKI